MAEITITAADGGQFSAYLAVPKSGKGPGVVVIQEIFGVNQVMREITDSLAAQGYTAICPDLFWRQKPGIQITDKTKAEWDQAMALMQGMDQDKAVEDLKSTLAALRKHPACSGRAGAVGYCLGGRLAFMMATRSDADATVSYYGVMLDGLLGESRNIKHPLLMHIAEKDQFVPPEVQTKIKEGLRTNSKVTMYTYKGADHAFARIGGGHYDKDSADMANARTAEFFKRNLAH
jgi:carboxymethylenebutenolidase